MHIQGHVLQTLLTGSALSCVLFSCGGDRVNLEFRTSPEIYVDDSRTDPDKLNRELEYDLREAEKKRRQKEREAAEARAKAEAEKKIKEEQKIEEQTDDKIGNTSDAEIQH